MRRPEYGLRGLIDADVAELADAHGSGPCSARIVGSTPTVGTIVKNKRVWHIGCAPAFQAG